MDRIRNLLDPDTASDDEPETAPTAKKPKRRAMITQRGGVGFANKRTIKRLQEELKKRKDILLTITSQFYLND